MSNLIKINELVKFAEYYGYVRKIVMDENSTVYFVQFGPDQEYLQLSRTSLTPVSLPVPVVDRSDIVFEG